MSDELQRLADEIAARGYEIWWLGSASDAAVDELASLLNMRLSRSIRGFLKTYGGGGIIGADISGIEGGDAANDGGGTIWGDTKECRARFGLPEGLAVIYFHDDEVCWCLDGRDASREEQPVVSYDVFGKRVDRTISPSFDDFLRLHLSLYANAS